MTIICIRAVIIGLTSVFISRSIGAREVTYLSLFCKGTFAAG